MKRKKKLLISLAVVVTVAFISGVSILAATTLGTQQNPLVTLSYLTSQFKPQVMSDVNASLSAAEASLSPQLDAKVESFKSDIDAKLSASSNHNGAESFTLVTLKKNQTISCALGTELLLRVGTATGAGGSPSLVDTTTAATLSTGGALTTNHMYMVTIDGNGLKATAATVKVLVRGTYTIA